MAEARDGSTDVVVRRIRADEGKLLRDIRLRALREAPDAFASTVALEAGRDDTWWVDAARARANSVTSATFVAEVADVCVGLVGGFRESTEVSHITLASLWVDPGARGRGIARLLIAAVVEWAVAVQATAVELWVRTSNVAAGALYETTGFVTENHLVGCPDDCTDDTRMVLRL